MRKTNYLLLAGLIATAPWAAADLSYTNVSLGYAVDGEVSGTGIDLDGLVIAGSVALSDNFYLFGNYQALETDPGNADVDRIDFGAGYHVPIANGLDFDGSLAYSDLEIGNFDGDGFQLMAGLRGMPTSSFEWHAHIVYEDLDFDGIGDDSDTGYSVGGRFFFAPTVSAGVNLRDVSDIETLVLDVRFDF